MQPVFDGHERAVVVAGGELAVDGDAHAVLLLEVEEEFLLVAYDDGDVGDAGLVELLDLALDHDLAAHLEQALGTLVGDGRKARGKPRCEDDRVVDFVGGQRGKTCGACPLALDQAVCYQRLECRVDGAERQSGVVGKRAL